MALETIGTEEFNRLKVKEAWFNVRTLFRNLYSAIENKDREVTSDQLVADLHEEILFIKDFVSRITYNQVNPQFYFCYGKTLFDRFPLAKVKIPRTELQIKHDVLDNETFKGLVELEVGDEILLFEHPIAGNSQAVVMVTHQPIDLLLNKRFQTITLLESHTGRLKSKAFWNTKLSGGTHTDWLPFNYLTLQVCGDRSTFNSMSRNVKADLFKLAKTRGWHSLTTNAKVRADLKTIANQNVKTLFLDLFNSG
ncbi:hypothetical protein [Endozoicomonas sp. ONNA1]|uniref:hypothetical protein n=1 Tax=Endozoicomonas sp. ONNA1 TaxID=2828740 RepID=UPI002148BDCA|nr:hypothetical protein [Endozoicomonas sp. ONNA1]